MLNIKTKIETSLWFNLRNQLANEIRRNHVLSSKTRNLVVRQLWVNLNRKYLLNLKTYTHETEM